MAWLDKSGGKGWSKKLLYDLLAIGSAYEIHVIGLAALGIR